MDKQFLTDVFEGLSVPEKSIPSKYFYDQRGSEIFEEITRIEEYYLTECEREILKESVSGFLGNLGDRLNLIELGAGDGSKTADLLSALQITGQGIEYHALDISRSALRRLQNRLASLPVNIQKHFTEIDFETGIKRLGAHSEKRNVVLFLGSSLGNMTPEKSITFLKELSQVLNPGDVWLLGLDLIKERGILERAYNDSKGLTKRFNLNLLTRMNRELRTDFCEQDFEHVEYYDEGKKTMTSFLESKKDQNITLPALNRRIQLKESERIHTEYSFKYDQDRIEEIAEAAGLKLTWQAFDHKRYYTVVALTKV